MIRSFRPDVLHTSLFRANALGVPVGRLVGVPIIVSAQRSLWAVGAPAGLGWWAKAVERWSDIVVCNSEVVRLDAIRAHAARPDRLVVIRNGVAVGRVTPLPSGHPVVILSVANLIPYKGHHVLLRAFADALSSVGRDAAVLRLAGAGQEGEALRRLAVQLRIDDRVEFLGSIADPQTAIESSAFTVLASLSEGLPNAVLESMAAGRAVVASAVGGVPELLSEGAGVSVPPGDVQALAQAMVKLISDPERRQLLGEQGRRDAETRFSEDRMVRETLAVYERVLSTSRRRPRTETGTGSRSTSE
jgi:glycosyltransferase involved in cell wall biosynthesis